GRTGPWGSANQSCQSTSLAAYRRRRLPLLSARQPMIDRKMLITNNRNRSYRLRAKTPAEDHCTRAHRQRLRSDRRQTSRDRLIAWHSQQHANSAASSLSLNIQRAELTKRHNAPCAADDFPGVAAIAPCVQNVF